VNIKVVSHKTGEEKNFDFALCPDEILIGSDSACNLVLEDGEVFPQHARFAQVSHHYFLRIEREEFQVGEYTVCATQLAWFS
jgi:hypothetical protein